MKPFIRVAQLTGCARCHSEGHEDLVFYELTHPVEDDGKIVATHWTTCPTTGEPILMIYA